MRSASLTSRRSRTSPVPSRLGCRVCSATQSGHASRSSNTSSHVTTRSPGGTAASRQPSSVVLPACVPPATMTFSPHADGGLEEARGLRGDRAAARPGRRAGSRCDTNLRTFTAQWRARDVGDDDVQAAAVGQRRVDERRADVDPAAGAA